MNIHALTRKITGKQNLTVQESVFLANGMLDGSLTPSQIASTLTALHMKGESSNELFGFITSVRAHMLEVEKTNGAIDVCGTGGDGSQTFNISTAVSFVVAGAGVPVAKHGNRKASSQCGSADVLENLGVNIQLTPKQAGEVLRRLGMVFLFAPNFHPTFKHVVPVRQELGIRTIFNYIGPFASPAGVTRQLIGVPNLEAANMLASVASRLGMDHIFLVTSSDGLDEISLNGKTTIFEIKKTHVKKYVIDPKEFGFKKVSKNRLIGGSAKENAKIIKKILKGEIGPGRDVVVLNSAYALLASGKVNTPQEGLVLAQKSIDSGSAFNMLEKLKEETKKYE